MKLLKSFGWSTASTLITVVSSLSFYKIFSYFLGPPGVTLLSHIQNLISISITLSQDGVNKGVVKYLAGEKKESFTYKKFFFSALLLQLFIYLSSLPFLYLLLHQTKDLPEFLKTPAFFGLFALSTFMQIANLFLLTLLVSAHNIKLYSLMSIFSSLLSVLFIYLGIQYGAFFGCVAILFSPAAVFFLLLAYHYRFFKSESPIHIKYFRRYSFKQLSHFLLAASSVLIFGRFVDFFVRILAIERFDVYQTGLWQSTVKLSDGYSSLFTGILGIVFYPKISALINNKQDVRPHFLKMSIPIVALIIAGLLFIYTFQKNILSLIFDESFIPAEQFLNYQLVADAFKLTSWLMIYLIMARAKIKTFFFLQFISAFNYIVLLAVLCKEYGAIGLGMATLWRCIIYFLVILGLIIHYYSKPTVLGQKS